VFFYVAVVLVLVSCGPLPKDEALDLISLDHYVIGQITLAPGANVEASGVLFYESNTNDIVPIEELQPGVKYDFSKVSPNQAYVLVITPSGVEEPTHISVAKKSSTLRCPAEWAQPTLGRWCEVAEYYVSYP
jgi:hypothetical protein